MGNDATQPGASPEAAEGPEWIGPYRLLERLGEGGMGVVWLAERKHPVLQRVALKVIRSDKIDRTYRARFEMEQHALARMDHPNIARLFAAGDDGGRSWFAMEYVPGQPLTDYCREHRLSVAQRLAVFAQLCDGVQHAHGKGILHRDLKPGNILVREVDGVPVPKIIDFGLAQPVDPLLIRATLHESLRQIVGTFAYMSPEQAGRTEGDLDIRTDVYSLGVVLYELLTGELPIDLDEVQQQGFAWFGAFLRAHEPPKPSTRLSALGDRLSTTAAERATSPHRLRSAVRGELDWVTMKALARDRQQRYATVRELGKDIERFLRQEPVEAGPPGVGYVLRKWVVRHRLGVGVGMGFALVFGSLGAALVSSRVEAASLRAGAQRTGLGSLAGDLVRRCDADCWPETPPRWPAIRTWLEQAATTLAAEPDVAARRVELAAAVAATPSGSRRDLLAAELRIVEAGEASLVRLRALHQAVTARLARAESRQQRTVVDYATAWAKARRELAADPRFVGFDLPPVAGLVPLGRDPMGWQVFYLIDSAASDALPVAGATGFRVGGETGLLFTLLPGGEFGVEVGTWQAPRQVRRRLRPFLMSTHEVSVGQWVRLAAAGPAGPAAVHELDPSGSFALLQAAPGQAEPSPAFSAALGWEWVGFRHPVRNVSWRTAHTVLQRWGLAMPTVAQWVWAVQLSTKPAPAADWTMVPAGIRSNMRDACYEASSWGRPLPVGLPDDTWDGFAFTCPVDALAPNPCGLFGMLGNVAEFVRDGYQEQPPEFAEGPEQRTVDAEQIGEAMVLGGSFLVPDKLKAEHFTQPIALQNVEVTIGVRAVMPWPEAGRNEK